MATLLLTGSGGYFGSIARRFFAQHGWRVLTAGRGATDDLALDLDEPDAIAQLRLPEPVDAILHAAAAHEVTCAREPLRAAVQNVVATHALLGVAARHQVARFVYLSTFHVFGQPRGRIVESTSPSPTNSYGLTHLQAELALESVTRAGHLRGLVVRPANFFGMPPDLSAFHRWTLTPFAFIREGLEQGAIVLRTPGHQRRCFVSVEAVCSLIAQHLAAAAPFSVVHATGDECCSIRELAQLARTALHAHGREIALQFPEAPDTETPFTFESEHPQPPAELRLANFLAQLTTALLADPAAARA